MAIVLPALAWPTLAQIPGLRSLTGDTKPVETPTPETPAQAQTRAAEQLEAARSLRDRLVEGQANGVPEGVGADEVAAAYQAISQFIFAVEGQQRAAQERDDARKARADAEAATRQWTGFTEQPPYSMLLVDDLREAAAARRARIAAL
jgi:potassium efflux system protein